MVIAYIISGVLSSFIGFAVMARLNFKRGAVVVLGLGGLVLIGLGLWWFAEDHDVSRVGIGIFISSHLGYMLAGLFGWNVGIEWRKKSQK